MKKKLIGIFVLMLLITTAFNVSGIQINNKIENLDNNSNIISENIYGIKDAPPKWLKGSDQKQTEHISTGFQINPPFQNAQEFKPTRNNLTAVAIEMFKFNEPPAGLQITVSIRDSLNGSDLTSKTRDADIIKYKGTWVLFDFEDINVTPEVTYYIICSGGGGDADNTYAWLFGVNNSYDRGVAWASDDDGDTWTDMENYGEYKEVDFCFITYHETPNDRSVNKPFFNILENFLNLFPILRQLLGLR